jgi:hypothetical protein
MTFNPKIIALIRNLATFLLGNGPGLDTTVSNALTTYTSHLSAIEKHEGTKASIAYAKGCRRIAVSLITNEKVTPLPFRKSNKQGIPRAIVPLIPLLIGSQNGKRIALTIIDLYKGYHLKPDPDIRSIIEPGVEIRPEVINDYTDFITRWIKSSSIPKVRTDTL